jgi:hypothetical protein
VEELKEALFLLGLGSGLLGALLSLDIPIFPGLEKSFVLDFSVLMGLSG